MKKIIGVLGVAVIAATMFFNVNGLSNSNNDTDLSSLIAIDTANAEWVAFGCANGGTYCGGHDTCKSVIVSSNKCGS